MALVTTKGHIRRAEKFYDDYLRDNDLFFVVGGQEDWTDEPVPDTEDEDTYIDDIICYKRAEQVMFVVLDEENGTIDYRGEKYRVVLPENIYDEECRWIMCTAWLNYDEAPVNVEYRKIGIVTGAVPSSVLPAGQYVFLPEHMAKEGIQEVVAHDTVTVRSASKRERLAVLMEF